MLIATSGCFFPIPSEVRGEDRHFDAARLEGRWFVVASNFPMWIEGPKHDPTFVYRLLPERSQGEPREVDDVVWWQKGETADTYLGIDTQDPHNGAHFVWRGKGALHLVSTDWFLAASAPDGAWAIVYYQDTVASPEGVDIIARTTSLSPDRMQEATAVIEADSVLARKAKGLVRVKRTDAR